MNITEIIEDIITSIDSEIIVNEVKQLDGSYELLTCNCKHATKCNTVSIEGNDYDVIGYSEDGLIVTGSVEPIVGTYTIEPLTFIHGTYINANTAMLNMDTEGINFNTVAFFVSSPLSETADYSVDSIIKTTVSVQMLLLKSNDSLDWCPSDHYTYAIYPMRVLADSIINTVNDRRSEFSRVDTADIDNLIDVGIEKSISGTSKPFFSYTFSGVVMEFQLPINKNHKCCNS